MVMTRKMTQLFVLLLVFVLLIAGCAQAPARPMPIVNTPEPVAEAEPTEEEADAEEEADTEDEGEEQPTEEPTEKPTTGVGPTQQAIAETIVAAVETAASDMDVAAATSEAASVHVQDAVETAKAEAKKAEAEAKKIEDVATFVETSVTMIGDGVADSQSAAEMAETAAAVAETSAAIAVAASVRISETQSVAATAETREASAATLQGRAILPAATFADGPPSGTLLGDEPINGQAVPFEQLPVQGFSAIVNNGDGTFWALSDNGYGSIENSADYPLRLYRIQPTFQTSDGGEGAIEVLEFIELHDPDGNIPFIITNQLTEERILTGADFDIESVQRVPDGTFWIGDEFGPFLLHVDTDGKVLDAPIPLPDVNDAEQKPLCAPQNPLTEEGTSLRLMNAVRAHARANGNMRTPVFSPWSALLDDGNLDTNVDTRTESPTDTVKVASSELFNINSEVGMQANNLKKAGFPVVVWTVNEKADMLALMELGVDGLISDRPDLLREAVQEFDADGDGTPGDYLTEDGLVDATKFDAQGHRGGRNLRPENTLPAMEVALDNFMTTLELDLGISSDGVPMLSHDPEIQTSKCRYADGSAYDEAELIKDHTAADIQTLFVCDQLLEGRDAQQNDPALSPVAVAFAEENGLPNPYTMPTFQQVIDFVDFYIAYYREGPGQDDPEAELRWRNAEQVRYNAETKINPRTDRGYAERTIAPEPFAVTVADVIVQNGMEDVVDIQSFDFRTLLVVQEQYPAIRTVYLFGDWPIEIDDSTNLQPDDSGNSPWLAGLPWPYRINKDDVCAGGTFRVQTSGGFEGMALTADGTKLLPLLEKPLAGGKEQTLLIHEFDLESQAYTGVWYEYPMHERGAAIGDFIMYNEDEGLIIERDGTQGDMDGFKAIYKIRLGEPGTAVEKELLVDLLDIADPDGLSASDEDGIVGVGETFAFPFVTIESVYVQDPDHIGVLNDNNYPFSIGRHVGTQAPDDNEFIVLKLDEPLMLDE